MIEVGFMCRRLIHSPKIVKVSIPILPYSLELLLVYDVHVRETTGVWKWYSVGQLTSTRRILIYKELRSLQSLVKQMGTIFFWHGAAVFWVKNDQIVLKLCRSNIRGAESFGRTLYGNICSRNPINPLPHARQCQAMRVQWWLWPIPCTEGSHCLMLRTVRGVQ